VSTETLKSAGKSDAPAKSLKIWLDGRIVSQNEAMVSVFDHGLLYGDGVFEGIRAYAGRVFRLQQHLERLYRSARAICLDIPQTPAEMEKAVLETCRANGFKDCYIRLVVTRGAGGMGLDPRRCSKPTTFIITDVITLYPEECYRDGLEIGTVSTRRNSPQALSPNIKSLNYLNNVLAKIEANQLNVREALMLNLEGYVAECTADNVFFIREGRLVTPPTTAGALEGITRNAVMELARAQGLAVEEKFFTPYDLYIAEEVFLTGTAAEVVPVVRIDARVIGDGKPGTRTRKIMDSYRELTRREGAAI
jgi:branched-chain amino acid aminotransferase